MKSSLSISRSMFRQVVEEAITFSVSIAEMNGQHVVTPHDVVEALETMKNSYTKPADMYVECI